MYPEIEINNFKHMDTQNHSLIASLINKHVLHCLLSGPGFILNWIIATATYIQQSTSFFLCQVIW